MVIVEEGRHSFIDDASILSNSSECDLKGECLQELKEAVDKATSLFIKDDLPDARDLLDKAEDLINGEISFCHDRSCSKRQRRYCTAYNSSSRSDLARIFGP